MRLLIFHSDFFILSFLNFATSRRYKKRKLKLNFELKFTVIKMQENIYNKEDCKGNGTLVGNWH